MMPRIRGSNVAHGASGTPGNASPATFDSTTEQYGEGSEISTGETWIYYVGARDSDGTPALFQQRLAFDSASHTASLVADELVEAVDTMQALYGTDADGDGAVDQYVAADAVTDWSQVVAVRVAFVMRSPAEYGTERDTQVYDVNGTTFDPADDRRVRQVFTTTVAIRNRLP